MASHRADPGVHWVVPAVRGILPLDGFHVPRRLRKTVRQRRFEVRCDTDFEGVVRACAAPRKDHPETWINAAITRVFCQLHRRGLAHSVETRRDGRLVGGLYGVALGSVFFGESMFSWETDASKVALVHLVALLRLGGFTLLDVQFVTDHLSRFGAVEISSALYLQLLDDAARRPATFHFDLSPERLESAVEETLAQSSTQTS